MDRLADWLKQSKSAPLVASLLVVMLLMNTIFDFVLKAPAILQGKPVAAAVNSEAQETLNSLVTTLRSTTMALNQINESNGKIITALQAQSLAIGEVQTLLQDAHKRQVTKTEFQTEIDALKKKVEKQEK